MNLLYLQPIDTKRDDYRKYLEKSGLVEAVSKVLVHLYHEKEKPANAIDYILTNIGDSRAERDTIERLQAELAEARKEIETLKKLSTNSKGSQSSSSDVPIENPKNDESPENAK